MTVGIYLFDEIEVLDFSGPFEVFTTSSRVKSRLEPGSQEPFQVITLAKTLDKITTRGGLKVFPDFDLSSHPAIDVLIIPGGVVKSEIEKPAVIDWIQRINGHTEITASVCTGAFLLARAGLLDGLTATTHWEDQADLKAQFPHVNVLANKRWVETGKLITSGGISAGIEMSLHLVDRLESRTLAVQTAHQMEYFWDPDRLYN